MDITRSPFNRQIDHVGNVRHGVQTGPWRVEFPAAVKKNATATKINQGTIISLDANGKYVIGCAAGSGINRPVPFLSMKNVFDPDVMTGLQDVSMARSTYSAVGDIITAIPFTAGYELETTEFDKEATYNVNDGVVPGTSTKIGFVVPATEGPGGSEPYLGFVSIPPTKDQYGNLRLAIQSDFIPASFSASGAVSGTDDVSGIEITGSGTTSVAWSVADGKLVATLS